jgi:chemotaxis-related protein WspD
MESKKRNKRRKTARLPNAERVVSGGAALLLDRALPSGYLSEWTDRIADRHEYLQAGTQSVVIFRIGAEWLALPTSVFEEVAEDCPFHSLPHRAGHPAGGLVTVRGDILTCVSLETLLGLERDARAEGKSHSTHARVALVAREGNRFAFPVSEVCVVARYHPRELQEVPTSLARAKAAHTLGLLPWQGHTVGCLDDELLFYTVNKVLA